MKLIPSREKKCPKTVFTNYWVGGCTKAILNETLFSTT